MHIFSKLEKKLEELRSKLNVCQGKLQRYRAQTSLRIWRKKWRDLHQTQRQTKRLAYDSGVLSEAFFLQLLALDGLVQNLPSAADDGADDEAAHVQAQQVRQERKLRVVSIKRDIQAADAVRAQALRLQELQERRTGAHPEAAEATHSHSDAELRSAGESDDDVDMHAQEPGWNAMAAGTEGAAGMQGYADETANEGADEEDPEAEQQEESEEEEETEDDEDKEDEHDNEKEEEEQQEWRPRVQQQRSPDGGLEVLLHLPGVSARELEVHRERQTITVAGVRRVPVRERLRMVLAPRPFSETLRVPLALDAARASYTHDAQRGVLAITLPPAKPMLRRLPATHRPAAYRPHSSPFAFAPASVHSSPFHTFSTYSPACSPQPCSRQAHAQRSAWRAPAHFFGGLF